MIDLKITDIKVSKCMLDPFNPRFVGQNEGKSQDEILNKMLSLQATKELMNSMKLGLQWVNRIVVRKIKDLSDEEISKIPDTDGFEYIVIEGNTRLACLKSETLKSLYGGDCEIPVLLLEKDKMSQQEFEHEIKIIQARANVMIVKEWEDIPKFRHIYNMYLSEKNVHPNDSFAAIVDRIKNTTGGKSSEVRTAIERCMIVDKVAEESDLLEDKYWPFVEAFETNKDTRKTIGINENHEFVYDPNAEEYQKELINDIPRIIKHAYEHLSNGKQFRDKYKDIVKDCNGDVEQILTEINDIMDDSKENKTWQRNQQGPTSEQKWESDLKSALSLLENFPNMASWAKNYRDIINSIIIVSQRQLETLDRD